MAYTEPNKKKGRKPNLSQAGIFSSTFLSVIFSTFRPLHMLIKFTTNVV